MLILVNANNFIIMLVSCGGVKLCSYLLINFWFTRIKVIIINCIGNFSLIIRILLIFISYKSVNYAIVFALTPFFKIFVLLF